MEESVLFNISLTLILFFLAVKLFLFQTKKRQHYKNLPPSPPSYPIIGHLHLLRPPVHRTLRTLSTKCGPVFCLWFGYSRRVVVVSSPSAVEECFTKNDIVLANRPRFLMGKHLGYNYTTIMDSPYGDHWRNLRRIVAVEIFSSSRLNLSISIRRDEIKRFLRKLSQKYLINRDGFKRVELKSMLPDLTFNIMMRMVAGKHYYGDHVHEAQEFREIMKEIFENIDEANPLDLLPILNWIPGCFVFEKRMERLAQRVDSFLQCLVDEHRNKKDENRNITMIDHLLSLQESQPKYYTDQII